MHLSRLCIVLTSGIVCLEKSSSGVNERLSAGDLALGIGLPNIEVEAMTKVGALAGLYRGNPR